MKLPSHVKRVADTHDMPRSVWVKYRDQGIGGSDVGTILGMNRYMSRLELFALKTGQIEYEERIIPAAHFGTIMEDAILDQWQYWDWANPTMEQMISNYQAGRRVRKNISLHAILRNERMPWFQINLDKVIAKHGDRQNGILEAKTISDRAASVWGDQIPLSYYAQVQAYMMVMGYDYGEIITLNTTTRSIEVKPIEQDLEHQEEIAELTFEFWQRVLQAQPLVRRMKQLSPVSAEWEELRSMLDELEPAPQAGTAYGDYIDNLFGTSLTDKSIDATDEIMDWVLERPTVQDNIKELKERDVEIKNHVKAFMKDAEILNCGDFGYVTWKPNAAGKRVMRFKIKPLRGQ